MAYPKLLQSERMLLGLAAAVTLAGASGCLGAPPRDRGKAGDDAGAGAGPPGDLPLPRLSRDEYVQTLRDLTTQVLPSEADQVLATVIPLTKDLPADTLVTIATEKHGGFARVDQSQQQQYSDVPIAVAVALAAAFTSTPARMAAVVGP